MVLVRIGKLEFRPTRWPTLAGLFFFVLTVWLGNWQLTRAEYKRDLQARYDAMQYDGTVRLTGDAVDIDELRFRTAEVRGEFVESGQILVDNRLYKSLAGYHVITPFRIEGSDRHVLINRGWVQMIGRQRAELPEIPPVSGRVVLRGIVVPPQSRYYEFSGAAPQGRLWQNLDFAQFQQRFSKPLLPLLLEQTTDTHDNLVRDWPRPDTGVGTHISYAIQWFGLAATIVVLWLVLNTRKIKNSEKT